MELWIKFWTIFFFVSLTFFAGLSIVVSIGGLFDIFALFKNLRKNTGHENQD